MNTSLNTTLRNSNLEKAAGTEFDLLVIGGGITGAGIALDAASRGLSVFLCEKGDFASGTSSRSTKLIHGGLRYLNQFELGLVRESGREREVLFRLAPNRVIPEKMLLPIREGGSFSKLAASIGLWLYDRLAGVAKKERKKMLSVDETLQEEPLLKKEKLRGGGLYYEYRTDDARLVMDVLKTAVSYNAQCYNYLEFTEPLFTQGKICGGKLKEKFTGKEYSIQAKVVVNAGGPWVDKIRNLEIEKTGAKQLRHTKGVHIVVPHSTFPIRHAVYFDVGDGRMVFVVPREATTYIGTTDTDYQSAFEEPVVKKEDVQYLLYAVQNNFTCGLSEKDIISTWAGIRPLIQQPGKSPSEVSRKDEIFISEKGLISIAGGKLTGYRKMAERITDLVLKNLQQKENRNWVSCKTNQIILVGNSFPQNISSLSSELIWLRTLFGNQATSISEKIKSGNLSPEIAALAWCMENEGVCTVSDFLNRRTGWMLFQPEKAQVWLEKCQNYLIENSGISVENCSLQEREFKAQFSGMLIWD